ncbi:MAG TPA: adenine phosphoribosyltransferase [Planctomycetota bacterium]|nr:adenine phosphoribosyltransferase [Planctomycetota bacterium]
MDLKRFVRDVPDFPKPGILFKDITPLLRDAAALRGSVEQLAARLKGQKVDAIAGIESRGFLFAATLALQLGLGLIPLRKPNKLPHSKVRESYALEYGTDALEMHEDAIRKGDRIALVDDLLATGGTMGAACKLVERCGASVVACLFVIELAALKGRERLGGRKVESLLIYE